MFLSLVSSFPHLRFEEKLWYEDQIVLLECQINKGFKAVDWFLLQWIKV